MVSIAGQIYDCIGLGTVGMAKLSSVHTCRVMLTQWLCYAYVMLFLYAMRVRNLGDMKCVFVTWMKHPQLTHHVPNHPRPQALALLSPYVTNTEHVVNLL
eukprot:1391836-Amorphochlora_amoeboformis.AAC.1